MELERKGRWRLLSARQDVVVYCFYWHRKEKSEPLEEVSSPEGEKPSEDEKTFHSLAADGTSPPVVYRSPNGLGATVAMEKESVPVGTGREWRWERTHRLHSDGDWNPASGWCATTSALVGPWIQEAIVSIFFYVDLLRTRTLASPRLPPMEEKNGRKAYRKGYGPLLRVGSTPLLLMGVPRSLVEVVGKANESTPTVGRTLPRRGLGNGMPGTEDRKDRWEEAKPSRQVVVSLAGRAKCYVVEGECHSAWRRWEDAVPHGSWTKSSESLLGIPQMCFLPLSGGVERRMVGWCVTHCPMEESRMGNTPVERVAFQTTGWTEEKHEGENPLPLDAEEER